MASTAAGKEMGRASCIRIKHEEEWREMASAAAGKEMGRVSYVRIKHEEEQREASWKEPEGRVFSATMRTDVAARLGELRDQILASHASFADLAA